MSLNLEIMVSNDTGLPYVRVPITAARNLLDFLATQKIQSVRTIGMKHITVYFLTLDRDGVQLLIDNWARSQEQALTPYVT